MGLFILAALKYTISNMITKRMKQCVEDLEKHLNNLFKDKAKELNEAEILLVGRHLQRVKFYVRLDKFGYNLFLKPVKLYNQEDGSTKEKQIAM